MKLSAKSVEAFKRAIQEYIQEHPLSKSDEESLQKLLKKLPSHSGNSHYYKSLLTREVRFKFTCSDDGYHAEVIPFLTMNGKFLEAVKENSIEDVEELVTSASPYDKQIALCYYAKHGNNVMVEFLVEQGASATGDGSLALYFAIKYAKLTCVFTLLRLGAAADGEMLAMAKEFVSDSGMLEAIEQSIAEPVRTGFSSLQPSNSVRFEEAVKKKDLLAIKALLPKVSKNCCSEMLYVATNLPSFAIVKLLLDNGADAAHSDSLALRSAVLKDNVAIAVLLLEKGANVPLESMMLVRSVHSESGLGDILESYYEAENEHQLTRGDHSFAL